MVSSLTAQPVARTSTSMILKASSPEFRVLGLRPREARLEVIRRALTETAGDAKAGDHWNAEEPTLGPGLQPADGRLAQVAVAGYRLLDPRRRRTLFERVQLLLWTEEDSESPAASLWEISAANRQAADNQPSSQDASAALTASGIKAQTVAIQSTESSAQPSRASTAVLGEETQAALEVFRSLRSRDRRATALWVSVAALAISLPGAVALFLALL